MKEKSSSLFEFFWSILINSVIRTFARCVTIVVPDFQRRRSKPHRDAKWNFTRGTNGISDKLDDSNVARFFSVTTNLGRRFFLHVATDRWNRRDGEIKIFETTKQTGERKEKLEENVLRETRTKGRTFRDASSFHPSSSSSSSFAPKTYIIRNRSLF